MRSSTVAVAVVVGAAGAPESEASKTGQIGPARNAIVWEGRMFGIASVG